MAVTWNSVVGMLQEVQATATSGARVWHLRLKGKRATFEVAEKYQIRKVRHLVSQLDIPKEIAEKHIPEF